MRLSIGLFTILVLIFGFLTGATFYFYNKSRSIDAKKPSDSKDFQAQIPTTISTTNEKIDSQTVPADPKGRLSYPGNIYKVQAKESLFAIGNKFGLSWQLIKNANGLTDENLIQADYPLAIPKLSQETDYYRVNFLINQDKASELNRGLRTDDSNGYTDPVAVTKKSAEPYFGIRDTDSFRLIKADLSQGTATVEAKNDNGHTNLVGLIQPKEKGDKGLWAILYVEKRDDN